MNILYCALISAFLTGFSPAYQQFTATLDLNTDSQTVLNPMAFQMDYFYKSDSLFAEAGIRSAEKEFDAAAELDIFPFQFNKWKIGILGRFHFRNESEEYNQYDFFAGFNFVINPVSWFEINPRICYYGCLSEIIPLRPYGFQWFYNNSHFESMNISFLPVSWLKLFLTAENCEFFYYRLTGSVSFTAGVEICAPVGLVFRADVISRWIDFFTVAANYDGTNIKLSCGYRW